MIPRPALTALLLISISTFAAADEYVFRLDGEEVGVIRPNLPPTTDLTPGEIVLLRGHMILLGPPGTYELLKTSRRLKRKLPDGCWGTFHVRIGRGALDDSDLEGSPESHGSISNPLAGMAPEEKRGIRGVDLQAVDESVLESLAGLDHSRAVISWWECDWRGPPDALPRFPPETRNLVIRLHYNLRFGCSKVRDFGSLTELRELRRLIAQAPDSEFDLAWIRKNPHLEVLDLTGQRVRSRELLVRFPELRRLVLNRSAIRDIPDLAKLSKLEYLHADLSRLAVLPAVEMSALKELHLMGSEVGDEAVERFREKNPQCRVFHRWTQVVREALAGADAVRVFENDEPDRAVVEVTEREAVRSLVLALEFAEGRGLNFASYSSLHDPILSIEKDGEVLARLGLTFGEGIGPPRALRIAWPEVFPGDGTLTDESADLVVSWLAERGRPKLSSSLDAVRREEGPRLVRWKLYERFIPEATYRWFHIGVIPMEVPKEFAHAFPDPHRRAQACVLLFGVDEGSWDLDVGLDEFLATILLPGTDPRILSRVAESVAGHPMGANGLGRWLFGEGKLKALDRSTLRKVLPDLARRALAHPRRINRQRTMDALAKLKGKVARELLEEVAEGKVEVRPLPDDQRREVEGRPLRRQEGFPPERDVSDAEYAREKLASMRK